MIYVITISDSCSAGTSTDTSGPHLVALIKDKLSTKDVNYALVPDEKEIIQQWLIFASDVLKVAAIFTTGGTGFAPRDVTPEATRAVITKEAPQLTLAMTLKSLEKTKFAVLSRAVCGVRNGTLIVNLPGSKKAVEECFLSIADVLPHVMQLLGGESEKVRSTHKQVQMDGPAPIDHVCPHATGKGGDDRNSPYPMIEVDDAVKNILSTISVATVVKKQLSCVNIPPFRASVKDGYAVKSNGGRGVKKVVGYIAAGDGIKTDNFHIDECYKINTGAPVPSQADAIVQIEDTKLVSSKDDIETVVEILSEPTPNLDIRDIGSDLRMGEEVFEYRFPLDAPQLALLASIGKKPLPNRLKIAVISTGDELVHPYDAINANGPREGKIYDSNTTMLLALLRQFGFTEDQCEIQQRVVKDDFQSLKCEIESMTGFTHVIICTGGVSMGDKDFVKPVLQSLGYDLVFGRINMKPGKPATYASSKVTKFFGLPGNPVSAFVTFHLLVLPALRMYGAALNETTCTTAKCQLPKLQVELYSERYDLDPRPEYVRASIISTSGRLAADITGKQISSRLKSTILADALVRLPARTASQSFLTRGAKLEALILRPDFISRYE